MKRGSVRILPLILFLFVVAVFLFSALISFNATAQNETNVNNANIANVTIQLSKDKYQLGQQLEGKLLLRITNLSTPDGIITVRMPGFIRSFKLTDLFQNISVNFSVSKGKFEGANPSSAKSIAISEGQEKLFGVILPAFSEVITLNMSVSGAANNQLKKPNMDIGRDGIIDWFYLGNFIGWNGQASSPENLIETEGKIIIRDSGASASIYCQRIDLPFSKDYNVTVSYKSLNANGDLKAVIYSIIGDPAFPTGGSNFCDLPESQTFGYHSCTIKFPSAEHGDHLVCVYNDGASVNDAYELSTDISHETETAFSCQRTEPVFCEPAPNTNYFIKVYGAQYSEALTSTVNFDEWSLGINASLEALKKEVGSDPYPGNCAPGLCLVPISVQGTGSGTATLSSLKIRYETGGIAKTTVEADKLYDVIEGKDKFATINGMAITGSLIIEVPLSLFRINATAPKKEGAENATAKLEAGFGNNLEANTTFTVFFGNIPAEGSQLMINEIRDSINALPSDEDASTLLELSGLKQAAHDASSSLASFETKLLISGDAPELQSEISALKLTLPKSITKKSSIADIQLIEPNDVTSDIADSGKKEDVYLLQDSVSVTARLSEYEVTDFSGNIKAYTLVKKTIKAKKGLSKLDVFESISKNAASSAESIKFRETPKVVNSDPLVKWYLTSLSSGQAKEFVYLVESPLLGVDDFKTIIATSAEDKCGNGKCDSDEDEDSCAADCKPLSRCGDGVCTIDLEDAATCPKDCKGKFPWLYVVIGVIILGGVLALYLLKGKKLFRNENDLKIVTDYIKASRQKKVKDEDIGNSLMQRGWAKTQVDYAFSHLASNVDVKPLHEYVQKEAAKNIPLIVVRQKLLAQGWDEKIVDRELKQYQK